MERQLQLDIRRETQFCSNSFVLNVQCMPNCVADTPRSVQQSASLHPSRTTVTFTRPRRVRVAADCSLAHSDHFSDRLKRHSTVKSSVNNSLFYQNRRASEADPYTNALISIRIRSEQNEITLPFDSCQSNVHMQTAPSGGSRQSQEQRPRVL